MNNCDTVILEFAKGKSSFRASDLSEVLKGVSLPVINATLSKMTKHGELVRTGRGLYERNDFLEVFSPEISGHTKSIYKLLREQFPFTRFCVYEGSWISGMMHHIAPNHSIYIEVERYADEAVFEWLKSKDKKAIHKPDADFIYKYVDLKEENYIVKIMTSQSPLRTKDGVEVPALEKLLVDMYCDKDFSYLQGSEYYRIMAGVQERYSINRNTLIRYASRRNAAEQIDKILTESRYDID